MTSANGAVLRSLLDRDARLIVLALILLLAAAIMPPIKLPRSTYDYIVVFDISQSMGVEDYELDGAPASRLDYARAAARSALRDLPCGSRVGWGVFAEYRTLLLLSPVEVCGNYNDLVASLENVDGRMRWANASEIAKGVYWSLRAAKDTGGNPSILFLTDGQEAPPLDPTNPPQMFDDLKPGEITGWLMGAGGDTPQRIPKIGDNGKRVGYWRPYEVLQRFGGGTSDDPNARPREHLSSLREGHLKDLAHQVGLDYTRLSRPTSISAAMQDSRFAHRSLVPTDLFWLPAVAALGILAFRFRPL
jgi:mxaL protein